jgi:serine/threonine-protein kinase
MSCHDERCLSFLRNELTPAETEAFELHLEVCEHCQQLLLVHAGGDEIEKQVKQLLVKSGETPFLQSASTTKAEPFSYELSQETSDALLAADVSILSPSDLPDSLGRIGTFEAKAIIGRGGMGTVYKALDPALGRTVAVKVLRPELASIQSARQRFSLEARAMASVAHQHVVPIYAVDEHRGLPYLAMEYVPGGTLESRLKQQGPLELISVLRITQQIALALEAAHDTGIVHRDIKPANILLDRGVDRVRVADFGLVRVSDDASMTRSGMIAGTPLYMAPEQVKGEVCDPRSDLFSLGSLVYTLIAGVPPFQADSPYAAMQKIVHDQPKSLLSYRDDAPDWLCGFVAKLLEKRADDRFQSARQVVEVLEDELNFLQNPDIVGEPVRKWLTKTDLDKQFPVRANELSPLSRFGLSALLLAFVFMMGWTIVERFQRDRIVPPAGDLSTKDVSPGPMTKKVIQIELVPLWNNDGFREFSHRLEQTVQQEAVPDMPLGDSWKYETELLRRNMAKFEAESF